MGPRRTKRRSSKRRSSKQRTVAGQAVINDGAFSLLRQEMERCAPDSLKYSLENTRPKQQASNWSLGKQQSRRKCSFFSNQTWLAGQQESRRKYSFFSNQPRLLGRSSAQTVACKLWRAAWYRPMTAYRSVFCNAAFGRGPNAISSRER